MNAENLQSNDEIRRWLRKKPVWMMSYQLIVVCVSVIGVKITISNANLKD